MSNANAKSSSEMSHQHNWLEQFHGNQDLSVLEKRALLYKKKENESDSSRSLNAYIHFRLGDTESYAISYANIDEIITSKQITPVPCVPNFIAGVLNRRSKLLPVYDLANLFQLEKTTKKKERIWVVCVTFDSLNYSVGILVDEIYGNDTYIADQLSPPLPASNKRNCNIVKGIIDGKITLIDVEAMMSDQSLKITN